MQYACVWVSHQDECLQFLAAGQLNQSPAHFVLRQYRVPANMVYYIREHAVCLPISCGRFSLV